MSNRDSSYRRARPPIEPFPLAVVVRTASGTTYRGDVLTGSAACVETRFSRRAAPLLALGQPATLTFFAGDDERFEVRATAMCRGETADARRYRFDFERSRELRPELLKLFNQRRAFRVDVDPLHPVTILMESGSGLTSMGRLKIISSTGLSLVTGIAAERSFAAVEQVEVHFQLPVSETQLALAAWIRNRQLVDEQVVYGVEFDPARTVRFADQEQTILTYVMERQRQMLRSVVAK